MDRNTLAWLIGAVMALVIGLGVGLMSVDFLGVPQRWWPLVAVALAALCVLPARGEAARALARRDERRR